MLENSNALYGWNRLIVTDRITAKLIEIFKSAGLRAASQKYKYEAAGNTYRGENVYSILHAPRGDATEAIVLVAAWTNMQGKLNERGVTLALTLTRYFKRGSARGRQDGGKAG